MATTRNYTRDATRKQFKYGGDDISSRIFEILSCITHIFGIIYHLYTLRSGDSTKYYPKSWYFPRTASSENIMTSGNISSNHPSGAYINDKY